MGLVVTNGFFYITESDNGNIEKVEEESKARQFGSVSRAIQFIKGGGNKTRHYHVYDTETKFVGNLRKDANTILQKCGK